MSHDELWEDVEENSFDLGEDLFGEKEEVKPLPSLPENSINLFDPVQCKFYENDERIREALDFIKSRRLDTAKNRPDAFYMSFKDYTHKNRVTIPFKNESGKIIFYQSRKIFEWDEKDKYISKSGGEKSICGMDKVSTDLDSVFFFEGPIDSFFVKNGLGVGGINAGRWTFTPLQKNQLESLKFYKKIWVLDSQWQDKAAFLKTQSLIEMGETVFIWPESLGKKFKDLNEMCIKYQLDEISPIFIQKNSYHGKAATLLIQKMKFIWI